MKDDYLTAAITLEAENSRIMPIVDKALDSSNSRPKGSLSHCVTHEFLSQCHKFESLIEQHLKKSIS